MHRLHVSYRKHSQRDFVNTIYQTAELSTILSDNALTVDTDFFAMIKVRRNRLTESFHLQTTLLCLKDRAVSSLEGKGIALFYRWYCLPKYALCAKYFKPWCHSRTDVKSCSSFLTSSEKILNALPTAFKARPWKQGLFIAAWWRRNNFLVLLYRYWLLSGGEYSVNHRISIDMHVLFSVIGSCHAFQMAFIGYLKQWGGNLHSFSWPPWAAACVGHHW